MARLNYSVPKEALLFYRRTKLGEIIDEFIESGADVAEFLYGEGEYSTCEVARTTLLQHLKKRHIATVMVTVRKGHVYLIRKEIDNA